MPCASCVQLRTEPSLGAQGWVVCRQAPGPAVRCPQQPGPARPRRTRGLRVALAGPRSPQAAMKQAARHGRVQQVVDPHGHGGSRHFGRSGRSAKKKGPGPIRASARSTAWRRRGGPSRTPSRPIEAERWRFAMTGRTDQLGERWSSRSTEVSSPYQKATITNFAVKRPSS